MQLTRTDVEKVAELARLEFSEAEIGAFTEQLARIVAFVERLNEVPTDGVEELAHPLDIHTVTREDAVRPGLDRGAALGTAPSHDGEFFLVPPVMAKQA